MFIHQFKNVRFFSRSAKVKLPRSNLILDPRVNSHHCVKLKCHYHSDGITVTLTIIEGRFSDSFSMRVYDPTIEDVPNFDSTIYTYSGLDEERAPFDTTVATIAPSVKTIKARAFSYCSKMKKCIIYDGVETIEKYAFYRCISLDALFLPSSLKNIKLRAFSICTNIKILSLPVNINISQIGESIIYGCDTFFRTTQIQQDACSLGIEFTDKNDQVHQAIIDFYRNLPPLHRACLDVNVNVQTIRDSIITHGPVAASITDHDGMTPLHILTINPHATLGSIEECFDADTSAAFVEDDRGNTPLDYLKEHNLAGHNWIVTSLCVHREACS